MLDPTFIYRRNLKKSLYRCAHNYELCVNDFIYSTYSYKEKRSLITH